MNTVGHLAHGLWAHPRDRSSRYTELAYWLDLARTLEHGLFDGLFLADATGVYDVYGSSPAAALSGAIQLPVNDPLAVVAAMSTVTRHLGFGVTAQVGQEAPYLLARRFSTLDHLSRGRIGWNIVTGFLDSAARAAGQHAMAEHDERYARADDYLAGTYRLWEESWADDAVIRDRSAGIFADPAKVVSIRHQGPYYPFETVHLSEPSPQRTPVLYQAGASPRGLDFAAHHAECIFLPNTGIEQTARHIASLVQRLAHHGRTRADVKVLTSVQVIVAATDRDAQELYQEYKRYAQPHAALAQLASATGIDFSRYAPDEPIALADGNGIRSAIASLSVDGQPVTVNRLLETMPLGGRFTPLVGAAATVADQLIQWADASGVDGFNLVRTVTPEGFEDVVNLLVPALQSRGRFKTAYAPGTYREKLFGAGRARLPANHPGTAQRPLPSDAG